MTKECKQLQHKLKKVKEINDTMDKYNRSGPFIKQNLEIEQKIESLLYKISSYRNMIKDNEDINPKRYDSFCSICQIDSITHCINPCGHTYCNECSNRLVESKQCYICRKYVIGKIKMYMS